jgi:hypothetical protein
MRNFKIIIFFSLDIIVSAILCTIHSHAENSMTDDKAIYEVVPRQVGKKESYPNSNLFVIKKYTNGRIDKNFHEIKCFANIFYGDSGVCTVIKSGEKLLLSDCFHHSSVCYSCRLVRFNSDGTLDSTFKSPFSSSHDELVNGSPKHEIKNIFQVNIEPTGMIRIEGEFISPLIGWTREQGGAGFGDDNGKDGIVILKKDGSFNSFIPNNNR